ncbi:L-aspartate oxidase [Ichthyobacterium seriolicida]|uniref:L-aspartate oxidase n=1 Tax=Ichthyobacterium seriolicida TaxID=242600 RepID=A0A1J1EBZ3_9FLAO|nr:L-aspartate oxidase [Ichthyobacterium seriolicida]BAV95032.1 L-aspartate oxidase [Ichthyobacterium seriolicida]
MINTDFLIIGGGIAGLSYAIKVAEEFPQKSITVITKGKFKQSNTQYAQGGIAGVLIPYKPDEIEKHIEDTFIAGDFKNNKKTVELVVKESSNAIQALIDWGVDFDRDKRGKFLKNLEGGHSKKRILHHKDFTGREIQEKLLSKASTFDNISMLEYYWALDLIIEKREQKKSICNGIYAFDIDNKKTIAFKSKITVIASGGVGQLYKYTTNPEISTGDGIAIAHRAGAKIEDISLIQFHPTTLYQKDKQNYFLISEAVRGEGAILRNLRGEAYMHRYSEKKDLAPRDVVARANLNEMRKENTKYVYLDVSSIVDFQEKFPNIFNVCKDIPSFLEEGLIPVTTASHYVCGGIKVNINGETSIENLYACGECAHTGMHGSNRLASNSLLEAIVFSQQIFKHSSKKINDISDLENDSENYPHIKCECETDLSMIEIKDQIKNILNENLGIEKRSHEIRKAKEELSELCEKYKSIFKTPSVRSFETKNMLCVAELMINDTLLRKENTGVFYNVDLIK